MTENLDKKSTPLGKIPAFVLGATYMWCVAGMLWRNGFFTYVDRLQAQSENKIL